MTNYKKLIISGAAALVLVTLQTTTAKAGIPAVPPVQGVLSQQESAPFGQPLWMSRPEFRNETPVGYTQTNGALPAELVRFWDNHGQHITRVYSGTGSFDQRISDLFREYIRRGFANELFMNVMPFNQNFVDFVSAYTHFNIADGTSDLGSIGRYIPGQDYSSIFISTLGHRPDLRNAGWFKAIAVDELFHMLGYGENLNELVIEQLLGRARDFGSIGYDPAFMRTLNNKMNAEGRVHEFWAAGQQEDVFKELWDLRMGHLVSFDLLFYAKGADIDIFMHNPQNAPKFQADIRMSREAASRQLIADWQIIAGETPASAQQVERARVRFDRLVTQMANFAKENNIPRHLIGVESSQDNHARRFNNRQAQNPVQPQTIQENQEQYIQFQFPVIPLINP